MTTESETLVTAALANADNDETETEAEETTDNETEASSETVVYDESYTVAELRAAAKAAGITGYSSMTKAELLEALNGG